MGFVCVCVCVMLYWSGCHYVPIRKDQELRKETLHLHGVSSFVPLYSTHYAAALKAH